MPRASGFESCVRSRDVLTTPRIRTSERLDGLVYTGPSLSLRVRRPAAERFGLTAEDIAGAVNTAMLGRTSSSVLEGDRVVEIRVRADPSRVDRASHGVPGLPEAKSRPELRSAHRLPGAERHSSTVCGRAQSGSRLQFA